MATNLAIRGLSDRGFRVLNSTGSVAATLTVDPNGNNNSVDYTAKEAGAEGNNISIQYRDPGTANATLGVRILQSTTPVDVNAQTGGGGYTWNVVVDLATDGAKAITSTANQVRAAIAASEAGTLLTAANHAANDGTGVVTAMAKTFLSGGDTNYDTVKLGVSVTVDVDNPKVTKQLIKYNDLWVRASSQSVALRGLGGNDRFRDFRGAKVVVTGVKASATLTSDGTAPTTNDTVTIGNKTYTFKTALTPSANEVLIGNTVNAAAALTNLKAAINGAAGSGTLYAAATVAHTQVDAGTLTPTTLLLTAKTAGTAGNALASTETSSHLTFAPGGATFANGVDAVNADEQGVKPGASVTVDVDNQATARALRRNKSRYIVGASNLISVRGLSDRGVRIKDSGGTYRIIGRGLASRTVDVNDRNVANILKRNNSEWIEA